MESSAYAARILCQLNYAVNLSEAHGKKYHELLETVIDALIASVGEEGVITKTAALAAEQSMMSLAADAKKYTVHCVAHAHIDMNWMWGYQETVSVTVDTFRTVLDLMKEYPALTFAQSQASTYEIIEKYAPYMLDEIKERIREGRWEVSASTWVEPDKNMPSGESLARHILYTKRYLSGLLDIPAESLTLDYEPDTFGHNISVPEICSAGGVKYYYHSRGNADAPDVFVWRGRAGSELLVYREPHWYKSFIEYNMLWDTALLCEKNGVDCLLNVYGVGDHGGGPTRRDIEKIITMSEWPIMPNVIFSTYGAFFGQLEKCRASLPIREGESNFVFDGCYTSESKIKMANRIAEDRMYESEAIAAGALMAGGQSFNESFREAWKSILFNQFHDILPGSGIADTREHAMGRFQDAMAAIGTNANSAMRAVAARIDTTMYDLKDDPDSISQGGGVGFGTGLRGSYSMPYVERGMGKKRIFHFFNPTEYNFDGVAELMVYDWNYDGNAAVFSDSNGRKASCKLLERGKKYWDHMYKKYAVSVKIPAFGYATYSLDRAEAGPDKIAALCNQRTDEYTGDDIVLENGLVKAVFDHRTMQLKSFVSKKSGKELIASPACTYRMIRENTVHKMSAWRVGDYMSINDLNETCDIRVYELSTCGIKKWVKFDLPFAQRSKMDVCVILRENSSILEFDTTVDYHEIGNEKDGVPQLGFTVPLGFKADTCKFDVPFGTIERKSFDFDVPANSFAVPVTDGASLMLISDSKYGFRFTGDRLSLALIRSSYHPDPYPEYGVHHMRIGVGICEDTSDGELFRAASAFVHPICACAADIGHREGELALDGSFLKVEGDVKLSAVKTAEDFRGIVVRFSDISGRGTDFGLTYGCEIAEAYSCDINENALDSLAVEGNTVRGHLGAYEIKTVIVKLK